MVDSLVSQPEIKRATIGAVAAVTGSLDQEDGTTRSRYRNVLVRTSHDRETAYTLRYDAYVSDGHIKPSLSRRFSDHFDYQENCSTFLLMRDDVPIGSLRTCVYLGMPRWDDIPAFAIFRNEIEQAIGLSTPFVEINRFVLEPTNQGAMRRPKLVLFNNVAFAADMHNCEFIIIAVRDEHISFYRQMNFEPISGLKPYPLLNFSTRLLALNWRRERTHLCHHRIFSLSFDNSVRAYPYDSAGKHTVNKESK